MLTFFLETTAYTGRSREEEEKRINKERAHIQAKFKGACASARLYRVRARFEAANLT